MAQEKKSEATEDNKLSKGDAVRQAVAALGKDATMKQLQEFVRKHTGLEVSTTYVYGLLAELKGSPAKKKSSKTKAKPAAAQAKASSNGNATNSNGNGLASTKTKANASESVSLDDLEAVKLLAQRNGPATLRRLIDLVAK